MTWLMTCILHVCVSLFPRGTHHWVPRTQRLFGGQIVGQALVAAAKSVSDNHYAHSLHCYFVRAGKMKHHWNGFTKLVPVSLNLFLSIICLLGLKGILRFLCCTRWNAPEMAAVSVCARWRPSNTDSRYSSAKPPFTCNRRAPCSTSSPCQWSPHPRTSSPWKSSSISISGTDPTRMQTCQTGRIILMFSIVQRHIEMSRMAFGHTHERTNTGK